ncbi:DUF362 domain-containing protein [Eggerthella sp. YY7918]|uniref:DUF362 domain-containing protein n=1 Tax=Eggerthella sp. (strain YY7918) TaxID=502558 RepID=UPI0002171437|nr:DUF362 domain-containing protein [Eggerthella sp. YY7918]BAK44302.1 hypothetical protein EGYY_11290 [Eggerthella sp. YY7918]
MAGRQEDTLDRRTFVMGSAGFGMAVLAGSLVGCAPSRSDEVVNSESEPSLSPDAPASAEPIPTESLPYDSVFPEHEPLGRGVGACPGRVAWVRDGAAVVWDGSGYWWQHEHFNEEALHAMVADGIAATAGVDDARAGWRVLFESHNERAGRTGGYVSGQKIAIKANMNGSGTFGTSEESSMSYTTPVLLRALLMSLVEDAQVPASAITVYDVCRIFPDHMIELCSEDVLAGVRFLHRDEGGPRDAAGDENAPVVWSADVAGATNVVPACVSEADYLINLASLKGHSYGLTLSAKNHFGSLVNSSRLRPPEAAGIHRYVSGQTMGSYTVLVDLLANHYLGAKTMLWMLDGLVVATSEGATVTAEAARWESEPFNGGFTASLFFSQDPVALDSVGADFLINEPAVTSRNTALAGNGGVENYLHEAALAASAPSGTVYLDGAGTAVESLGVHEHWNNSTERLYSRDRGQPEGIELVRILR